MAMEFGFMDGLYAYNNPQETASVAASDADEKAE